MHLVGYVYEDYHNARSLEHKVLNIVFDSVQVPFVNSNCLVRALCFMQNSANSKFKMDCSSHLQMLCT
jgi:hypothetical protein